MEKFFRIHFRHIKRFHYVKLLSFDIQNHEFGWVRFQNRFFFKLLNNDEEKYSKTSES